MIAGSGWLEGGVWPWLGMLQGTVWTLLGEPDRGYDLLYTSANCASTAGTWVEEQTPVGTPPRTSGDFADAGASAVFLHLVRVLLAAEDEDTLRVLRELPPEWLRPGASIGLDNLVTDLGRVSFRLEVSPNGRSDLFEYSPAKGETASTCICLDLESISRAGFRGPDGSRLPEKMDLPGNRPWTLKLQKLDR